MKNRKWFRTDWMYNGLQSHWEYAEADWHAKALWEAFGLPGEYHGTYECDAAEVPCRVRVFTEATDEELIQELKNRGVRLAVLV
jgi:hypothetical protein